ncbi:MAG TPA: GNAT family N-acetyltransferase [Steroidobacteraceae bacterium]|nr:GNAT family N-acetyltransferase [Steroidobacteraceae bacterium]
MDAAPYRIATARLTLRRPTIDDAPAVFAYASDATVTRYMSFPAHHDLEETREYIRFALLNWEEEGVGAYLLEYDGRVIGSTGLDPGGGHAAATGYVLAREAWGCGYATEACRAMIELGRALALTRIEAQCHVDHAPSARVLEKAGMRCEGVLPRHMLFPNLAREPQDVLSYAWSG